MRRRLVPAVLLLALLLGGTAACSSGSSGAPASKPGASPTTTPGVPANQADAKFCLEGKLLESKYATDFSFSDTAKVKAAAADFRRLAGDAPAAIRADMETLANTFDRVAREGVSAFDQDQAAFTKAEGNLVAWIRQHCALTKG